MNVNQTTIAHARLALKEAMSGLLFNRNVNLIDFGQPIRRGQLIEDDLSIRIHVHKKLSGFSLETAIERGNTCYIPDYIRGFKADVIEGTYYQIGVCSDSSTNTTKFFINGDELPTTTSGSIDLSSLDIQHLIIGGRLYKGNNYVESNVGTVRIYNKSLSSNEILQNFEATKQRYGL